MPSHVRRWMSDWASTDPASSPNRPLLRYAFGLPIAKRTARVPGPFAIPPHFVRYWTQPGKFCWWSVTMPQSAWAQLSLRTPTTAPASS